jgi:hypothetical protein
MHQGMDNSQHCTLPASRRLEVRYGLPGISYVDLGEDNGGVILNICEGGVSLQSVYPLSENRFLRLRFKLPGSNVWIKVNGQIVWLSESKKRAGICFLDMEESVRTAIRNWMLLVMESCGTDPSLDLASTLPLPKAPVTGNERRRVSDRSQPMVFTEVSTSKGASASGNGSNWFSKLLTKIEPLRRQVIPPSRARQS